MKRLTKKLTIIFSALIVFVFTLSAAGCGVPQVADTETNIIIEYFESAYGRKVFEELKDAFEEEYKEYTVTLIPNPQLLAQQTESKLKSGPNINSVDMFFAADLNLRGIVDKGSTYINGYSVAVEDLSGLYEEEIDGIPLNEKLLPEYVEHFEIGGEYYSLPVMSGPNGIAYRADYFEKEGWEVPRTTEDLRVLIEKIRDTEEYVPFIWPGTIGYWQYCLLPWWAQYVGEEGMEQFLNCEDENGELSPEAFLQYGRYEMLYALEMCIYDPENSYYDSITYNAQNAAQMEFYNDARKICMMPNGEWLEIEMTKSGYEPGSVDVGLMKPPVLTSVLKIPQGNQLVDRFEKVKTNEQLSAVIAAIDAGEQSHPYASESDFKELKRIRSYTFTTGFQQQAIIPIYANAKEGAKKFLTFMYSDRGHQIYYDNTGSMLPVHLDNLVRKENETRYQKDRYEISQTARYLSLSDSKHPIFYKGGLGFFLDIPEIYIGSTSSTDKMKAEEYFRYEYELVDSRFDTYKALAGL